MKILSTNTINVPKNLSSITDIGREDSAVLAGMSSKQVQHIWSAVENLYQTGNHPMISLCLRRQGKIILNRSIGYAELESFSQTAEKRIAKVDTPVCLFSATKLVTAMLVHVLDEEGTINLLDPISYYIPEYAKHGKRKTTIFHILSHRGGIPRLEGKIDPELLFNKQDILQHLYDAKPMSVSNSRLAYHAVTAGYILGEILERVTGQSLSQLLQERFAKPMGLAYFDYGLADQYKDQVAKNYCTGFYPKVFTDQYLNHVLGADLNTVVDVTNDPRFMDVISPAANIFTSAEQMGAFMQMLLNGGEYNGRRIMSPQTVFRATIPTTGLMLDHSLLVPMRYALGPMLGQNPVGLFGPNTGQAFGHLGFSNILCWADPQRDISVSLLTTGKSVVGTHLVAFAKLLHSISAHCPDLDPAKRRKVLFGSDQKSAEGI